MPVRTFKPNGQTIFDSSTRLAGICMGTLTSNPSVSVSKSFPNYPGATLKVFTLAGGAAAVAVVDYALGYPRVTIPARAGFTVVLWVYSNGYPAVKSSGIYAVNDSGSLVLSPDSRGLYHSQTITTTTSGRYQFIPGYTDSGNGINYIDTHRFNYAANLNGVAVLELPVGQTIGVSKVFESGGFIYVDTHVLPSSGVQPKLHIFRNAPIPGAPPFFLIWGTDGTVSWDLMRGDMLSSIAMIDLDASAFDLPPLNHPAASKLGVVVTQGPATEFDRSGAPVFGIYNKSLGLRCVKLASSSGSGVTIEVPFVFLAHYNSVAPAPYSHLTFSVNNLNLIDLTGIP